MAMDPAQVTVGGSAACLAVYVLLTVLVVYNSKKCGYCNQRLVVCNYLIAVCSFRIAIFALRLSAAVMDMWAEVPFWISYIIMPGATFCLAEGGAQLVLDWHWHGHSEADIPRSARLSWAVARHLVLSIAFVLAMLNNLTRNYVPIGYLAAGLYWFAAAAMSISAGVIWLKRRLAARATAGRVGVGALLFAQAFAVALAAQAVFVLLLALGRFYNPLLAAARLPMLESGVIVLNVVPDLLVILPAIAVDMGDLDEIRPFRFNWHRPSNTQERVDAAPTETVELRRRRTPPPPPVVQREMGAGSVLGLDTGMDLGEHQYDTHPQHQYDPFHHRYDDTPPAGRSCS